MNPHKKLKQEVQNLQEENNHLKAKLRLLGAGISGSMFTVPEKIASPPLSISGLESMYLQIDEEERVINVNSKMADLIGKPKEQILSCPLCKVDIIPWAKGVFQTLLRESRLIGDEIEFETSYMDTVSGLTKHLRFKASHTGAVGNITISDITNYTRILSTFERYVSPRVIEKMQNSSENFFRTERMVITVLFADLRGFTTLCTDLPPDEVKAIINEYLSTVIGVIDRFEATVDKIIGDEVMALFAAPIYYEDHAHRAIKAAIEIQETHQALLQKWKTEGRP